MNQAPPAAEWYFLKDNKPVGPYSYDSLFHLEKEGTINGDTEVARGGEDLWTPLDEQRPEPKTTHSPPPPLPGNSSTASPPQRETAQQEQKPNRSNEDITAQAKEAAKIVGDVSKEAVKVIGETGRKAADYAKEHLPQHTEIVRESFFLFCQRCSATRALKSPPTEKEAALLDSANVTLQQERTLMTWRRAMLIVAMVMMILTAGFNIPNLWEDMEAMKDNSFPAKVIIVIFPLFMIGLATFKTWGAFKNWDDIRKSRRYALQAACALSSQLILLAFIPLSKLENGLRGNDVYLYNILMAIAFGILFVPVVIGLSFGLMRGCLAARVFHPANPIPGSMLLVGSGLGFVIMLMISGLVVQFSGSLLMSMSFLCLLLLVAINAHAGYRLREDIPQEKVVSIAKFVERSGPWLLAMSVLFATIGGWDLVKEMEMNFLTLMQMIISTVASFCILTVAFCDLVTMMIQKNRHAS